MKKLILTSLILVLVPTLLFLPAYLYLVYTAIHDAPNYADDVQGEWTAIQYYYENQRIACKDDIWIKMCFEDDSITVDGTVLPSFTSKFTWEGGSSLSFEANGEKYLYLISFDNNNNLKIIIDDTDYIVVLRRSEG